MEPAITNKEILEMLKSVKKNTATGVDEIGFTALGTLITSHINFITLLFNACLLQGVYPSLWKIGKMIFLGKQNKDPMDPTSYCPITILPLISRLFEKIIFSRLYHFIHKNKLLHEGQFGFLHKKSTTKNLYKITTTLRKNREEKRHSVMISLDIKSAFNSLDHNVIIQALQDMSAPSNITQLISDFLKDRYIQTKTKE